MMRSRTGLFLTVFFTGLLEYYAFTAVNVATRNIASGWRVTAFVLYFILSAGVWLFFFNFRKIRLEEQPTWLLPVLTGLLLGVVVGKLVMASLMIIDDIRRMVTWMVLSSGKMIHRPTTGQDTAAAITRSQFVARTALLAGGLIVGGFLWGIRNRYRYQLRTVRLAPKNFPAAFKGLKVVQISDIHSGSFDDAAEVAEGIRLIMEQKPDLILFTGDLVNNRAAEIVPFISLFKALEAPMGVYSILGNHDYGDYVSWNSEADKLHNLETLKRHQQDMGWKLLMNEHVIFERDGAKIALLGIENWSAKPRFPRHGDMARAYEGLANESVDFKILMSHDPSHWEGQVIPDYPDIDLTLSGHTHGMQFGVRLPFFQWSPVQYMYQQWAGLYQRREQYLYVNVGFGFLGYRGRVGIKPEVTVFEFV